MLHTPLRVSANLNWVDLNSFSFTSKAKEDLAIKQSKKCWKLRFWGQKIYLNDLMGHDTNMHPWNGRMRRQVARWRSRPDLGSAIRLSSVEIHWWSKKVSDEEGESFWNTLHTLNSKVSNGWKRKKSVVPRKAQTKIIKGKWLLGQGWFRLGKTHQKCWEVYQICPSILVERTKWEVFDLQNRNNRGCSYGSLSDA